MYADDDEIVALLEVVREHGGYYTPHHRNYGQRALEAYADCIEIARRSGVPLHLAHAHLGYEINKGRAPELLAMIDQARDDGIEITLDTYPYLAGSTYLHAFLPSWMHVGGSAATLERLRDPALRERLRVEIEDEGSDGFHEIPMDWSVIVVDGRPISEAAAAAGARPIDYVCDLLVERNLGVSCIAHTGNEENVRTTMAHWSHTVGSDGIIVGDRPHPRGWGTFPRYFAVYVRELGILTWEQAVRKMTSLPAQRLGFPDRGLLRPGHGRRRHVHRPRDDPRHRDVRGSPPATGGDPVRARERRRHRGRRAAHRRAGRPSAPRTRLAGVRIGLPETEVVALGVRAGREPAHRRHRHRLAGLAAELVDARDPGVDVVDVEVHACPALVAVGAVDRAARGSRRTGS